jgi:hypothetical protein
MKSIHNLVSDASTTPLVSHLELSKSTYSTSKKTAGRVRVKTIDKEAKAGDDYDAVDKVLEFS